jgi:hypothetical protein
MDQSHSSEASHLASQEIFILLWNPKVHYRVHNRPPLAPILNHMNPIHTFPPYFPEISCNIIFPSTPRSAEWSLPFRFSDHNFICILISLVCYMAVPSPPCFDNPNNILWSAQVTKLLIMQSFPISHYFLTLSSKYSPQHPVLKTPPICVLPLVWHHFIFMILHSVPAPYEFPAWEQFYCHSM